MPAANACEKSAYLCYFVQLKREKKLPTTSSIYFRPVLRVRVNTNPLHQSYFVSFLLS